MLVVNTILIIARFKLYIMWHKMFITSFVLTKFFAYTSLVKSLSDHQSSAILCTSFSEESTEACEADWFGIDELMEQTTDPQLLAELWMEPRVKLGLNELKANYSRLAELWDIAAKEQNYDNSVNLKLEVYRLADELYDDSMAQHYYDLWDDVKEFYYKLHAVCLHLLTVYYPEYKMPAGRLMPAMFVGLFGQKWHKFPHIFNLYNKTEDMYIVDIPANMESMRKERSQKDYAILANELMASMNLPPLSEDYIEESYFVGDESKLCEGTYVLDFWDGVRVRAGVCADLNMDDVSTIYSLAADSEQVLLSGTQNPTIFRQIATDAWSDALSYFMIANFNSPTYLERINLLKPCEQSEETTKYYLMQLALEFYPLIAHAVVLESYRDDIFLGDIDIDNANCEWYFRVAEFQGLIPPFPMDENAFHPAIKHTLMRDITYLNFMYQPVFGLYIYEYLCEICNQCSNGEYLHQCDLTGCQEAGDVINKLASLGASVSWQTAFKMVFKTEKAEMRGKAMNRYFKMIEEDLDEYIEKYELDVGWEIDQELICQKKCSHGGAY